MLLGLLVLRTGLMLDLAVVSAGSLASLLHRRLVSWTVQTWVLGLLKPVTVMNGSPSADLMVKSLQRLDQSDGRVVELRNWMMMLTTRPSMD